MDCFQQGIEILAMTREANHFAALVSYLFDKAAGIFNIAVGHNLLEIVKHLG